MDNEPCSICLDQLFGHGCHEITRLQPCGHYYHPECIQLWRERSNQCPTCRSDYVLIESITQQCVVVKSEVADHVELPPAEDEFFEAPTGEDDLLIAPTEYARLSLRIDRHVAQSNTCALCDSNRGQVLSCNSCSSTFHGQCLGLGQERIAQWFCPMCSAEQGTYQPPSLFRRSRNSERTNRVYNTLMRSRNASQQIMTEYVVERPQMSPDEVIAWDSFEIARKSNEDELSSSSLPPALQPSSSQTQRKQKLPSRRSKRVVNEPDQSTFKHPTTAGPSLINTLLGQMKEHRPRIPLKHPQPQQQPLAQSSCSTSMSSESPSPTSLSIPTSPESPTPSLETNKSTWKMSVENNTLSFSQKRILQEIVGKKLRPMYKDGLLTEDQYTQVNMKVSRILYDVCLKDSDTNPDFEHLAHRYVEQEISQLSVTS